MLAEALEHLVRGVVDNPDDVTVRDKQLRRGSMLEVRVHPDDLGKVIGRGGRTATAFRTVIGALAGKGGARIDFVDVDRRSLTPCRVDSETIEVVVGRIGKPHGIRGEVTVEVRTDEPERRFADGAALRAAPPGGSAFAVSTLTVEPHALAPVDAAGDVRRDPRPQRRRGGPRASCCSAAVPADESPDDPDEFYDHQLVGLAAYDLEGARAR